MIQNICGMVLWNCEIKQMKALEFISKLWNMQCVFFISTTDKYSSKIYLH